MEYLPKHKYLEMRPDTLQAVRHDVSLDKPGDMKEAVRILDEWVRQQKHFLKKDFPLVYLEATIVMCKGSVERAKLLLDKMCTVRTLMPKYFEPYDVKKEFQLVRGSSYIVSLPKQTAEFYRAIVLKFVGKFGEPAEMDCFYRYVYVAIDYVKLYDYHSGVAIIFDISETDLKYSLANVNLFELKNCFLTLLESYGIRVKRVHVITASTFIDTLISFFKQFMKKKIMDRIIVHKNIEELQQYYTEDMLPKDYGGTERSLNELQVDSLEFLSVEEYSQHVKSMSKAKIDETLRPSSEFNDLYAGTYGTFRSLTLD